MIVYTVLRIVKGTDKEVVQNMKALTDLVLSLQVVFLALWDKQILMTAPFQPLPG